MEHLPRSPTHITMFSKRDFQSDTWLVIGITAIIFALLSSLGIWILCYRRRGHKRRMDSRRAMAAKTRGDYVQLDEEKGGAEGDEVQLETRSSVTSSSSDMISPRITPPAESRSQAQIQTQTRPSATSSPPIQHDRRRDPSPRPQPNLGVTDIPLHHPQPQVVYLPPPVVSNDRGRHLSAPEYNQNYDYDGRTGHRIDRSPSPSPSRLVLSRSISMLRPREQQR